MPLIDPLARPQDTDEYFFSEAGLVFKVIGFLILLGFIVWSLFTGFALPLLKAFF